MGKLISLEEEQKKHELVPAATMTIYKKNAREAYCLHLLEMRNNFR